MYSKKVTTNSGLPVNRLRSSGFWVATPTGQVSRWQTRIMMQPETTSGAVREAELLGAEQRRDDDVAAGLELAVDLHDDAVAQPVEQQRLLGLGQAELPGRAGVLERGQRARRRCRRRGPEISTTSACALETPAATVPTPTSATSLTWTRAAGLAFFRSWMSWARSSIE